MDIGVPELLIILFIIILIFGPGRLVKLGRELGYGLSQFRQGVIASSTQAEPTWVYVNSGATKLIPLASPHFRWTKMGGNP